MAMCSVHEISCPECQHSQRVPVYSTINVTLSPEVREDFHRDRINCLHCQECGANTLIATELVYNDMAAQTMIWLLWPDEDGQIAIPEEADKGIALFMSDGYRLRVVGSYLDLKEKVRIFDGKLDDRLIEMIKLSLRWQMTHDDTQPDPDQMFYDSIVPDDDGAEQLIFACVDDSGDVTFIGLPKETYDGFSSSVMRELARRDDIEQRWLLVDLNYAMEVHAQAAKQE
jgi:CpXC motif protein